MSKARRSFGRDAWERACSLVAVDDDLPVVTTKGIWTAKKLFFLCCYLEQTTRGMYGNEGFPDGITYLDLFCGAGVSVIDEDDGTKRRYPGSAVIAASLTAKPFSRIYLIDENTRSVSAAESRARSAGFAGDIKTWNGDVNECIDEVAAKIPANSLNVAFVDPFSLDVHFDTIAKLASRRAMDLIILFSDRIDLGRNVDSTYYNQRDSKLDRFLGAKSSWRARYDVLSDRSGPKLRQMFADLYCEQLASIGYSCHKTWPLEGPQGPMFRLVYASKNKLGLKFCELALNEDFGGEKGLWGGM